MKKSFLIFLILALAVKAFGQLNYTQNVNDIAQIKFPDTPVVKPAPGNIIIYGYQGVELSYIAQVAPFKKPANELYTVNSDSLFYSKHITEILDTLKAKLIYEQNIIIKNISGVEYSYAFMVGKVKLYSYNRTIFFNNTFVDYYILSRDSLNKNDIRLNEYFNSFKISLPDKDIVSQADDRINRSFGLLILIALVVLIGLGIVFLIKKAAYKKKSL